MKNDKKQLKQAKECLYATKDEKGLYCRLKVKDKPRASSYVSECDCVWFREKER